MSSTQSLPTGTPHKHSGRKFHVPMLPEEILRFALPIMAGMLFQQFYSMIDTAIVGRFLGIKALAGVGAMVSICYLFIGFCVGCSNGFAIPVSQRYGAGDTKSVHSCFANAIYISLIAAIFLTTATSLCASSLLRWIHTPEDIYSYSLAYVRIIFLGLPLTFLYNLIASMIRSLGNSKVPLYALLFSSGINIILDFWMIGGLHLGVSGAALATIVSQGLSTVLCFIYILRKMPILLPDKNEWSLDPLVIKELLQVGLPMGIQSTIMSVGTIVLQSAINSLGSIAVAAVTAAEKIGFLFAIFFEALGTALATFTGQNIGARQYSQLKEGRKVSAKIGLLFSASSLLLLAILGKWFIRWFLGTNEPELIHMAYQYLIWMVVFFPSALFLNIFRYMLQGMGHSTFALLAGVMEVIARLASAWILIPRIGFLGACFANPLAWTLAATVLISKNRSLKIPNLTNAATEESKL